jgi:hypothetical protein
VRHKFDGKDVGSMASGDAGGQFELRVRIIGLVGMDIDMLIIGA